MRFHRLIRSAQQPHQAVRREAFVTRTKRTMLEIGIQRKDGVIYSEARKVPIPEPAENEVLIRVIATDSNPKDWKASARPVKTNQGDDIAGTVHKVGSSVHDFKPGDRVAAFHRMFAPSGSYAEFAIAPASTTFFLPPNTSFESGATLPLASMTAALALYQHLGLPAPWNPVPEGKRVPVLIYGGSSAVGAFALKFAKLSNLSPIITVAGGGADFVTSLNAADYIVDYRKRNVVADVKEILDKEKLRLYHAFDAVSDHNSWKHVIEILDKEGPEPGKITMVDPPEPTVPEWPRGIEFGRVFVSSAYGEPHKWCNEGEAKVHRDFAYVFYRYMTLLLAEGRFVPHPYEVQQNGLLAVEQGVQALHDRKVSSKKLVHRVADTPDLERYQ